MKLLFLGDFLYNYDFIQEDIKEIGRYIKDHDYHTVLNLEAPLKNSTRLKKGTNLSNSNCLIEVLKMLNVVAVNIANNHIMDWGKAGLQKLLHELKSNTIGYFGAGLNIKDASEPEVIRAGNKTIGLVGYGWDEEMCVYANDKRAGVAPLRRSLILHSLKKLNGTVDMVIVNLHWGYEYELYPLPIHRCLALKLIDNGADLIIGHHPHVIQAYEIYKRRYIYYSLGNFYFCDMREFFNKYNEVSKKMSRFALGVICDVNEQLNMEEIFFESSDQKTNIIPEYKLKNISDIPVSRYNTFFKKERISKRKPSLYISKYQDIINPTKLTLCKLNESIRKVLYTLFKGIYH